MEKAKSNLTTTGSRSMPLVVSLWIDFYSEIFSDFDPRPFSDRILSDDFIVQVRKVSRDSRGKVAVLKLLVPEGQRKEDDERTIRRRLEDHFANMHQQLQEEASAARVRGFLFSLAGITLMIVASYISFLNLPHFHINLLLVLFEPAGWFLFWTGLDSLISYKRSRQGEVDFYGRMSSVHVEFGSIR